MAQSASGLLGSSPTERPGYLRHTDARRRTLVSGLQLNDPCRGDNGLEPTGTPTQGFPV